MSHPEPISLLASVRRAFLAGLVLLAPITVTLYVFNILVTAIGGWFRSFVISVAPSALVPSTLLEPRLLFFWNIMGTIIVLACITALGYLSRWVLGRFVFNMTELVIARLPFINTVYNSVKQIVQTFSTQQKAVFQKVVMVEYPRTGVFVLGFLTSSARGEPQAKTASDLRNVFIPTTPNPTSGFLLMVPVEEVVELDMTVGEGMKLIISGGAVVPEYMAGNDKVVSVRITGRDEPVAVK